MGFLASLDAFPLEKRFDQVLLPLQLQLQLLQTPQPLLGFQPLPRALDHKKRLAQRALLTLAADVAAVVEY